MASGAAAVVLSLLTASLLSGGSCAAADRCRDVAPPDQVTQYQRIHELSFRRPMLGPDGIQLDVLVTASATDRLAVWDPGADWICIALTTYAGNAHQCSVDGMASKTGDGEFLFAADACVIRVLLRPDHAELEVAENGCKAGYCAGDGAIESARYQCSEAAPLHPAQ